MRKISAVRTVVAGSPEEFDAKLQAVIDEFQSDVGVVAEIQMVCRARSWYEALVIAR